MSAQDEINGEVDSVVMVRDTPVLRKDYPIDQRRIDTARIAAYKADNDFIYDRSLKGRGDLSGPFLDWIQRNIAHLFDNNVASWFWQIFKYGFFILLILYALSKLLEMEFGGFFRKPKPKTPVLQYESVDENIHEMDFNTLIQEAIEQKLYRKAVRLYYLRILKAMTDKQIIEWQINKTNRDYRYEVEKTNHSAGFEEITFLFDYIWYGEFPIDEPVFKDTQDKFQNFISQIQRA